MSSSQDVDAFAQALRAVGEPIFGMDANKISMAKLLAHLFAVTERFGMQVRTELLLLQRTMVVVEGVARSLDPNMNMWETARPEVESYIKENLGPKSLVKDVVKTLKAISRYGPHAPYLTERSLRQSLDSQQLKVPKRRLPVLIGGIILGILFGTIGTLSVFFLFR